MKKILFLLLFSTLAIGQVQIQVSAPATLDQVNVADLDVSKLTDLPLLFAVTITNMGEPINIKLHFQVFAKIGNEPEDIFADAWSLPFTVDRILSFTNQDLASGRTSIKSDKERTQIYEDKIKKIKDLAQSTGRLPAGRYRFVIQLLNESETSTLSTWEKVYEVVNPSRIDLISPSYQSEVRTQFPIFKWIAPYFKEFEIFVYEKLPNQTTPEEVVSGDKNLRWKYKTTETQIQYPREALPLEDGKTYFWYVKSYLQGSRGTEEVRSEIWSFDVKLGVPSVSRTTPNLTPEQKRNLENLIRMLNQSGNNEIAALLSGIISDFIVLIDGRPATPSEIEEVLRLLSDKDKYEVIAIEEK
ncbi:hypothetical protein JGI7_01172 [Candidatus Kryptonium thompsonii]|uniref:Uncharacterized protein n=1 Tax=Candidatus Kryptonium thompsonii TaxID=1633631 RepID=A0A0P1M0K6_9BACT|nr:hypothetical protein [Candidatus Kryptonium thompsoni]CUS77201.1 hypothetical protein JGI8_00096 [Candidatus Kryptonium thompsoni]CUS77383.1 hypothetical protein JGI15_10024 [Candidatus Kryptonium thompsoni]CUS88097.1 hypothetical protein JGI7_01172 [Candidatus Kryptonium thompsoni]CUS93176.1 hypothetical protein JGI6_01691 [Candidatus Kryptonium thompsoni]CUS94735.1 hypothetical protein JGI14_10964 [Candidatus Kryptonium thompsoni]